MKLVAYTVYSAFHPIILLGADRSQQLSQFSIVFAHNTIARTINYFVLKPSLKKYSFGVGIQNSMIGVGVLGGSVFRAICYAFECLNLNRICKHE